jgi:4-hydroxybenzoate polyprenyltransferase
MKITRVLWLIYKRLRTAFGVSLGFILIYGAYTDNLTLSLLPIALGFWCIHVFGDCYNDYEDYEQDIKNNRKDKWTIAGLLTRKQIRNFSFFMCFFGLVFLLFINLYVFLLGLLYSTTIFCYSNSKIHLKLYDLPGYIIVEFPLLLLPITLNIFFHRVFSISDFFFALFCFSQYVYLSCQKDSTDLNDKTNLFLGRGWKNATFICIGFAILASSSLFTISLFSIVLPLVWGVNVSSKAINLYKIYKKEITRKLRARLILVEFLTPYLYTGGVILGL